MNSRDPDYYPVKPEVDGPATNEKKNGRTVSEVSGSQHPE